MDITTAQAEIARLQREIATLQAAVNAGLRAADEARDDFNARYATATDEEREAMRVEGEGVYDALDAWYLVDRDLRVLGQG